MKTKRPEEEVKTKRPEEAELSRTTKPRDQRERRVGKKKRIREKKRIRKKKEEEESG